VDDDYHDSAFASSQRPCRPTQLIERIANTKRLVNTNLPPDVEVGAGWDACMASIGRPAAQAGIQAVMAQGFHQPGEVENRLGYYLGQIKR
jgi:hypothetical protein